jgi:hypothetical protein
MQEILSTMQNKQVFHNKQLEKHVKYQMVNYSNEGCEKMLFEWAVQGVPIQTVQMHFL